MVQVLGYHEPVSSIRNKILYLLLPSRLCPPRCRLVVSPLCGPPGGHGGGVPRSGGAPSGGNQWSITWCGEGCGGMGSRRHLLLRSSNASEEGDVARGNGNGIQFPSPNQAAARVRVGARRAALGIFATISGHRRRGFADGKKRVAFRSPSDQDQARVHGTLCSTRASKRSQHKRRGPIPGQMSARVAGTV